MSRRHCVLVANTNQYKLRLGIWKVFDPWINPHLLVLQGYNTVPPSRPQTIELHFRRVVRRLVHSLDSLNQYVQEWDRFLEAGGLGSAQPELAFEIPEKGGIAADSVLHYLNLFIDDLARVIYFILADDELHYKEPDGFNKLKRIVNTGKVPASQTFIDLFSELDTDTSWWSIGFKRGYGIRQRLTHYTDLIIFRGKTKQGDTKMSGGISLSSLGEQVLIPDFEDTLEKFFMDFFEWLDRLDHEILGYLSKKLSKDGVFWHPFDEPIPAIPFPNLINAGLSSSHYMYLPVCRQP